MFILLYFQLTGFFVMSRGEKCIYSRTVEVHKHKLKKNNLIETICLSADNKSITGQLRVGARCDVMIVSQALRPRRTINQVIETTDERWRQTHGRTVTEITFHCTWNLSTAPLRDNKCTHTHKKRGLGFEPQPTKPLMKMTTTEGNQDKHIGVCTRASSDKTALMTQK